MRHLFTYFVVFDPVDCACVFDPSHLEDGLLLGGLVDVTVLVLNAEVNISAKRQNLSPPLPFFWGGRGELIIICL